MGFASRLYRNLYLKLMPSYEGELEQHLSGFNTLLDVGCGARSPIIHFSKRPKGSIGVDGFDPSLEKSKALGIHEQYQKIDVTRVRDHFAENSIEVVCALDLIEHLEKEQGLKFLSDLESVASKRVVIVTPTGFLPQAEFDGNSYQRHISGWDPEEMRKLGYKIYGIRGWKPLRGEYARFTVPVIGRILSDLTQFYTKKHPEHAFQMLCIKDL